MSALDVSWPDTAAAELPTATPDRFDAFVVDRDVGVRMRDGARLSANLFRPPDEQPHPAVVIRQPYGKDGHPTMWARGKYWARKGYACLIQDVRGKFASEGDWVPLVNEAGDGYDTLDWAAAQSWCDGEIGMTGESYHGLTQWAVAALGHPNLRCISPGDTTPDPYAMMYQSGALVLPSALWACLMEGQTIGDPGAYDPWHLPLSTLDEALGRPSAALHHVLDHPSRDGSWAAVDFAGGLANVGIPVLHWGGWYDLMLHGTLAGWSLMTAAAVPSEVRDRQSFLVGPTDHSLSPARYGGDGYAGAGSPGAWTFDHVQRFLDRWLRHENDQAEEPRVRVYEMGAERWRSGAAWPLPGTVVADFYLHSDGGAGRADGSGRLDAVAPAEESPDRYDYDPLSPVDEWAREDAWQLTWTRKERTAVEARDDVLVYESEPLSGALDVGGPLSVRLYVSSSAPCTDFSATLVDAFADGRAYVVQEGLSRVGDSGNGPLGTPEPLAVPIDLAATCYRFAPGHRVRLEVSSSIFGRYDRNPNTGRPFSGPDACALARQVVHHSRVYPSRMSLPVMPAEPEPSGPPAGPAAT